jgi:hypothetical protein
MDAVEALLPYRNATNIFVPIFDFEKKMSYFKILTNLRTYITHNENIKVKSKAIPVTGRGGL